MAAATGWRRQGTVAANGRRCGRCLMPDPEASQNIPAAKSSGLLNSYGKCKNFSIPCETGKTVVYSKKKPMEAIPCF